jgi:hypothetical protein
MPAKFVKEGFSEPTARCGISETGSDITPNLDKKRNKGIYMNDLLMCHIGEKDACNQKNCCHFDSNWF